MYNREGVGKNPTSTPERSATAAASVCAALLPAELPLEKNGLALLRIMPSQIITSRRHSLSLPALNSVQPFSMILKRVD